MRVGGKHSNRLAGILDDIGNWREMEERNSVLTGSPVEQNETTSTHLISHNNRVNQEKKITGYQDGLQKGLLMV
jgi:hypothetical protein